MEAAEGGVTFAVAVSVGLREEPESATSAGSGRLVGEEF